jgi:hypothetical protein
MRNLVYSVRHSVVPINSTLLTIRLYSSVRTALLCNNKRYSLFNDFIIEFDCIFIAATILMHLFKTRLCCFLLLSELMCFFLVQNAYKINLVMKKTNTDFTYLSHTRRLSGKMQRELWNWLKHSEQDKKNLLGDISVLILRDWWKCLTFVRGDG